MFLYKKLWIYILGKGFLNKGSSHVCVPAIKKFENPKAILSIVSILLHCFSLAPHKLITISLINFNGIIMPFLSYEY